MNSLRPSPDGRDSRGTGGTSRLVVTSRRVGYVIQPIAETLMRYRHARRPKKLSRRQRPQVLVAVGAITARIRSLTTDRSNLFLFHRVPPSACTFLR